MAQVGQWSHSLFGCFDEFGICIIAFLAPCVAFGQTAEALGEGSCVQCGIVFLVPILGCFTSFNMRGKIREMKGIEGSALNDIFAIVCCAPCVVAQEAQEVRGGGAPTALSMCRD